MKRTVYYLVLTLLVAGVVVALSGCRGDRGEDGMSIQGEQGISGTNGINGINGVDAAPTTFVKLCNETPSYPSTFVEYGICLQGKLYGVYSTNGGFLTYLPNGRYRSKAVGSCCDFTVTGCTITH